MKPLREISPGRRHALGLLFFILFFAVWAVATLGGFVPKTFLADPIMMVKSGWVLLTQQGFAVDIGEDGRADLARFADEIHACSPATTVAMAVITTRTMKVTGNTCCSAACSAVATVVIPAGCNVDAATTMMIIRIKNIIPRSTPQSACACPISSRSTCCRSN